LEHSSSPTPTITTHGLRGLVAGGMTCSTWLDFLVKELSPGIDPSSYDLSEELDGFVYAVDARTLDAQYMLRVVSLDRDSYPMWARRVFSAVLGTGSYNGYAYITGTAGNYYLEFTPFNPSKHNRYSRTLHLRINNRRT
jgi:hypothetical protein